MKNGKRFGWTPLWVLMLACCFISFAGMVALGFFGGGIPWERRRILWIALAVAAGGMLIALVFICFLPLYQICRYAGAIGEDDRTPDAEQVMRRIRRYHPLGIEFSALIRRIEAQKEQEYILQVLYKEAELNSLQSQINPHFLYNTLDAIRGQLMIEDKKEIADILEALSELFRYSTYAQAAANTFAREIENIENYMRIIRYRFGERMALRYVIDERDPEIYNCEIPRLTLQPIVENAIYHGIEPKRDGGVITVRAFLSEDKLHICVADDGLGMSDAQLDELNSKIETGKHSHSTRGSGIALVNVSERIRMRYGECYGLHIYSNKNLGTQVHILLPKRSVR